MKSKNVISYLVSLCMLIVLLPSCEDDNEKVDNNTVNKDLAAVVTAVATSISQFEAILSGSVISEGRSAVTEWGICIGTKPSPTAQIKAGGSKELFTVQVNNLEGGVLYYYRAYAVNANGISYGDEKIFTTEPVVPVVKTAGVVAKNVSITANGELIFDGGISLMEKGFCYGTMAEPTFESGIIVSLSGNDFEAILDNFEPFTDYYVRAFAINAIGTSYGDIVKVTTGDFPIMDMPFYEDFSGRVVPPSSWSMLDHDGDGKCWYYYNVSGSVHSAGSRSYEDEVLHPYNLLISPKIRISGDDPVVRWKTAAHSSSYYEEHYKVVVSEVPITDANCEDASIVKTVFEETLSGDAWADKEADLRDYIGKIIYIAWVHYDVSDESRMYIAGVEVIDAPPTVLFGEDFGGVDEATFPPAGWSLLDHDGDSHGWEFYEYLNGTTTATSHSYKSGGIGVLNPYNFLITPLISITGSSPVITWIVEANSSSYYDEHYKVLVSEVPITDANCEDANIVKTIFEETLPEEAGTDGVNRSADLSAYIGKDIYIAWVHYDCSDVSRMYVYDIKVKDRP